MREVTCSLSVSLDGYVVGPDGRFDWAEPDEEVFRFATEEVRQLGVHLLGRRLYESMLYWEADDPAWTELERAFADLWRALPKVVLSTTLASVEGSYRLATGGLAEERGTSAAAARPSPARLRRWAWSTGTGCASCRCWWAAGPRTSPTPGSARTSSSSTAGRSAAGSCTSPTASGADPPVERGPVADDGAGDPPSARADQRPAGRSVAASRSVRAMGLQTVGGTRSRDAGPTRPSPHPLGRSTGATCRRMLHWWPRRRSAQGGGRPHATEPPRPRTSCT
jgi:hypothetical protein